MRLDAYLARVQQAEAALEAKRSAVGAQWRLLGQRWRRSWTPGRLVIAGLALGFVLARGRPLRLAGGSGLLRLLQTLAPLLSSFKLRTPATNDGDVDIAAAGTAADASGSAETVAPPETADAATLDADLIARVRAAGA